MRATWSTCLIGTEPTPGHLVTELRVGTAVARKWWGASDSDPKIGKRILGGERWALYERYAPCGTTTWVPFKANKHRCSRREKYKNGTSTTLVWMLEHLVVLPWHPNDLSWWWRWLRSVDSASSASRAATGSLIPSTFFSINGKQSVEIQNVIMASLSSLQLLSYTRIHIITPLLGYRTPIATSCKTITLTRSNKTRAKFLPKKSFFMLK